MNFNFANINALDDMRTPEYRFVRDITKKENRPIIINILNFFIDNLLSGDKKFDVKCPGLPDNMVIKYYCDLSKEIINSNFPGVIFYKEFIVSRPALASLMVNKYEEEKT